MFHLEDVNIKDESRYLCNETYPRLLSTRRAPLGVSRSERDEHSRRCIAAGEQVIRQQFRLGQAEMLKRVRLPPNLNVAVL